MIEDTQRYNEPSHAHQSTITVLEETGEESAQGSSTRRNMPGTVQVAWIVVMILVGLALWTGIILAGYAGYRKITTEWADFQAMKVVLIYNIQQGRVLPIPQPQVPTTQQAPPIPPTQPPASIPVPVPLPGGPAKK